MCVVHIEHYFNIGFSKPGHLHVRMTTFDLIFSITNDHYS